MLTGEKIKEIRKRAGMTQEEFGGEIGVTLQAVGSWERGETTPTYKHALDIIKRFPKQTSVCPVCNAKLDGVMEATSEKDFLKDHWLNEVELQIQEKELAMINKKRLADKHWRDQFEKGNRLIGWTTRIFEWIAKEGHPFNQNGGMKGPYAVACVIITLTLTPGVWELSTGVSGGYVIITFGLGVFALIHPMKGASLLSGFVTALSLTSNAWLILIYTLALSAIFYISIKWMCTMLSRLFLGRQISKAN